MEPHRERLVAEEVKVGKQCEYSESRGDDGAPEELTSPFVGEHRLRCERACHRDEPCAGEQIDRREREVRDARQAELRRKRDRRGDRADEDRKRPRACAVCRDGKADQGENPPRVVERPYQ